MVAYFGCLVSLFPWLDWWLTPSVGFSFWAAHSEHCGGGLQPPQAIYPAHRGRLDHRGDHTRPELSRRRRVKIKTPQVMPTAPTPGDGTDDATRNVVSPNGKLGRSPPTRKISSAERVIGSNGSQDVVPAELPCHSRFSRSSGPLIRAHVSVHSDPPPDVSSRPQGVCVSG